MSRPLQRILYAEDEIDIQTVTQLALEAVGGFTVLLCSSGQEALDRVCDFDPDLILLDVMMPTLDGPSTLARLRETERFAQTPVVFMTAKVQSNEVDAYRELGAIGVIPKPFDPMALADKIQELWARHHA